MDSKELLVLTAIRKGDYAGFGTLYDTYVKRVYDFIYFKTFHTETAEDLCSLTWTKALEKISSFKPDKGSFQSWIYKIAQNTVIDHYRTTKQTKDIDDCWDLDSGADVARDVEHALTLEELQTHLAGFSSEHRDILIMRLWQGLSYKEIADVVGKSEANAKMIVSRSLVKLREKMPVAAFIAFILFR